MNFTLSLFINTYKKLQIKEFFGTVRDPLPVGSVGALIFFSWVMMGIFRTWRPERSWIDRLGRAIGVMWIFVSFVLLATTIWF